MKLTLFRSHQGNLEIEQCINFESNRSNKCNAERGKCDSYEVQTRKTASFERQGMYLYQYIYF